MTYSRLSKKRSAQSLRLAFIYCVLILFLLIGCLFLGLPILIKMALFLGNLRGSYLPNEKEDQIPPSPPIFYSLVDATNSAKINIDGSAEEGAVVNLFINDLEKDKTISETDGHFLFSNIILESGENEIAAQATDKTGNVSQKSKTISIIFDNLPPKIEIIQPTENSSFPPDKRKIEIKGQTDAGASLTINEHLVIVDSQGNFTFPFTLSAGQNTINFTAIDQAGNQAESSLNLRLE